LFEPDVQAIVMQQRDIHARRAAEVEARQHAEELTRSNSRLEDFARIAAHDLREPLLTIALYTELLARKTKMDANAKYMAQVILERAARMATLVDGLLSFASAGVHEPARWVNLQYALAQATQNLAVPLKTSGALMTVGRLPIVQSNEIHLVSLFQNLLSNAVKYRGEDPLKIQVTAERRGSCWVVKVADNGLGIDAEDQFRIFMPFVRLGSRKKAAGSGLGLAVCKKIVEELGGTIWVESKLGVGSTFCFTIMVEEVIVASAICG
jgi:light-regulated signal transduction histidine kinase (bacteriophytochrome)